MILCFDIGGTAIKVAEATGPDAIVVRGRVPTPAHDFDAFVAVLRGAIAGASTRPAVLAFSIAGAVDGITGRALIANIPCLSGRLLRAELEAALHLPVVLANDADCFALAEAAIGAGRGHDVVLGLILGTGVGGGVVVRGQLINGAGFAGEIGHGPVAQRILDDPPVTLPAFACGCGQTGCLDAVCSARGMERLHMHLHGDARDSRAIVGGWLAHDPAAARTIAVWLALLAGPLAMVQNVLGAGVIAVGGGLSNATPLVSALDVAVRARILQRFDAPLVVPARCAVEPGLIGAAILGLARLPVHAG
ncbi:N-acetylglucosamine kinase [Loktanella fryxellensis]|uniref:N-acetylglucosamine kinase n=1 Tax=Loktanella fryxellensis TaxID=245187 RepID=A0A1H8GXP7_9RHOB|nr:ROK family protein [Loktanella fryxellensis]SEN48645.1 N-acetylglucosamine kinase [Loktanella fryxellensis]